MFSMFKQLTLDGSTTLTNGIKVLPTNARFTGYGPEGVVGDAGNEIERTIGSVC
jgi:hypothetical protein